MKNKFSTKWKSSKRPGKKKKYAANAPLHIRRKQLSVNLSKDLRKKYGKRNIVLRKNDGVKVMRGKFKGKKGKVLFVDVKRLRVEVENVQVKKQDGSMVNVPLNSSNLQITELNLEDKRRLGGKEKSSKPKEDEKNEKKPAEKTKKEKTDKKTPKNKKKEKSSKKSTNKENKK